MDTRKQIQLRAKAAVNGGFVINDVPDKNVPGTFAVSDTATKRSYRVVYHGIASSWNSCDCTDFRTNGLGTCKHLEAVARWLSAAGRTPDPKLPRNSAIDICYIGGRRLRLRIGQTNSEAVAMAAMRYFDDDLFAVPGMVGELPTFIEQAKRLDSRFHVTSDALALILDERDTLRRRNLAESLDDSEIGSVLRTRLYPFQMEGIRFAFGAGRALIADEMGLGKTVQALATAELFKARRMASSVLVVCPTSLKYQWKKEIDRFTGSDVTVVEGHHTVRRTLYGTSAFYKIVSYHTLANDINALGPLRYDILIMDEVQRLKGWNARIVQAAGRVGSDYAVVLSGTPIGDKPEELYSALRFVDQYAPGLVRQQMAGDDTGYGSVADIRQRIRSRMLRRSKADVAGQLPDCINRVLPVPMTKEQQAVYDENKTAVVQLAEKWRRYSFLSEKDRKRLLLSLGQMRMVCDSTYVVDQRSRFDTKVAEAVQLVKDALENGNDKIVVLTRWERMARIVGEELEREGVVYSYLHGGLPPSVRAAKATDFAADPAVHVMLATDTGAAGTDLSCASVAISLDRPLGQAMAGRRMACIYSPGRSVPLLCVHLIASGTIEEAVNDADDSGCGVFDEVFDGVDDRITLDDDKLTLITQALTGILGDGQAQSVSVPDASELMEAGAMFVAALTKALSSDEATETLLNQFVVTDPATGRTEVRIPVAGRGSVAAFLASLRRMFGQDKR